MTDKGMAKSVDYENNQVQLLLRDLLNGFYAEVFSFPADARQGILRSTKRTLGGAGTVTSITLPNDVIGFRIYADKEIRFAISEDPAAESTTEFVAGGIIKPGQWESRLLQSGADRTLRLRAIAGGEIVQVEVF